VALFTNTLCTGTPTNLQFTFGTCFNFLPGQTATIYQNSTQIWTVTQSTVNSAPTCSSTPNTISAGISPVVSLVGCLASVCACAGGSCSQTGCQLSQPSPPSGYATVSVYNDSVCSIYKGFAAVNLQSGSCYVFVNSTIGLTPTQSGVFTCSGNTVSTATYSGTTTCSGTSPTYSNFTGGCTGVTTLGVTQYYQISCGSSCFHRDTEIIYKDEKLTLDSLKQGKHPSCTVPHIYTSEGVKLITSCNNSTLRLTIEHLVYTQRGLIEAKDVKVGDFIFQDLQETKTCKVISTEKENDPTESYFGLNCEESIVLANGFKTSTFGKLHFFPSLWMRIMTPLIGVRAASAWGDYLSHLVQRYKFF